LVILQITFDSRIAVEAKMGWTLVD